MSTYLEDLEENTESNDYLQILLLVILQLSRYKNSHLYLFIVWILCRGNNQYTSIQLQSVVLSARITGVRGL